MGSTMVVALGRLSAIAAVAAALAATPATAGAATITVTTASDVSASQCTLRDAISAANSDSPQGACPAGEPAPVSDAIQFALPSPSPSTITLGSALPGVLSAVSIIGPGAGQLTISGAGARQVLYFGATATASVSGLTVTEGKSTEGGGITNYGTLTLEGVTVTGNLASEVGGSQAFPEGGGIYSSGNLTLRRSVVSGNSAIGSGATGQNAPDGGGIYSNSGLLTIEQSTISGNSAKAAAGPGGTTNAVGGGILNGSGQLIVRQSTVSGNGVFASGSSTFNTADGAGIFNGNTPTTTERIEASTISGNVATAVGSGSQHAQAGGIASYGSSSVITSSTIAANSATTGANLMDIKAPVVANSIVAEPLGGGKNCSGAVESAGYNIEDGSSCGFTKAGDHSDTDPLLSPAGLADNGGPTATIALALGSPAIDQGLSAPGEASDQRGLSRPVIFPGVPIVTPGSNGADIGAFELQLPPTLEANSAISQTPPPGPATAPAPPRVRLSCPKSAKPGGCKYALQVVSAKPHKAHRKGKHGRAKPPVAESAVAKVKLAPGHSAVVTLVPKPKFAAALATAAKVLVREVETADGRTKTSYRRLGVVG